MPELAEFEGIWRITRRIEDNLAAQTGHFEGIARLTPDGAGGMAYHEVGELRLPKAASFAATRDYIWTPADDGGIDVLYEDGRDFHHIAPGLEVVQAWHDCIPDSYEVTYNFTHWPRWRAIWRVTGPRKDYTSITDFAPIEDGALP